MEAVVLEGVLEECVLEGESALHLVHIVEEVHDIIVSRAEETGEIFMEEREGVVDMLFFFVGRIEIAFVGLQVVVRMVEHDDRHIYQQVLRICL